MEDNIEVKDVQKTEYLDKNGLDMLWTKVKENTHNQVEVERNRAVAKENSISDKVDNLKYVPYTKLELSRYNIPDGISTGYITSKGDDNDSFDVYPNAELTSGTLYGGVTIHSESDEYHSTKEIKVDYDDMRIKFTDGTPSNVYAIYGEKGVDLKINNSSQSLLTADQSVKVIGTDIAPLKNGKVPEEYLDLSQYAKKTDIPEVDTSDFVSKSDTITQTINSGLIAMNELNVFSKGYYDQHASLRGGILVEGADTKLMLNDTTAQHNCMVLTASKLSMSQQVGDNTLLITTSGIANTDNNADHVYATDGSIADLTEYAKKSEITAGGNVNDVQVNGVSVVENKVANIKPATKEKLGVVKVGDGLNVTDGTISVDKGFLIDMVSYGVEWDTTVADPACTRIGNMSYHKSLPIQSEYKGCLVKNGKVNYYLDPNDWSKKADGTPSVLDGTDGDVMVHIPKFYGKSGSNGNKRWVRIATTRIDSSWVEIPEMFVSAYRITTFDDSGTPKIASVVNTTTNYRGGDNDADFDQYLGTCKFKTHLGKPRVGLSRSKMRTNASNSGQELLCYEFYKWVFYWAYVIEYANFNSQKEFNSELTSDGYHQGGLGPGLTTIADFIDWNHYNYANPITPCGYTNEFGNFSGTKSIPDSQSGLSVTVTANRWRGFENPFGDINTTLDGIVIKQDSGKLHVYTTSDSSKFGNDTSLMNDVCTLIDDQGYIMEFNLGETGEIMPKLVYGSTSGSKYKCDYLDGALVSEGEKQLLVGGFANAKDNAGLCYFYTKKNVDATYSNDGFRSVVRA